jgi:hypothetical protein
MGAKYRLAVAMFFWLVSGCASAVSADDSRRGEAVRSDAATVQPMNTNEVIRQTLYTLLERCGAVKSPQELANMRPKQRKLYERLRSHITDRYVYPDASLVHPYAPAQNFTAASFVRLGSYVIRPSDQVTPGKFPPDGTPDVRWLPTAQVFLKDPESDYYNLFVDCGYLVKNSLEAETEVSAAIVNAAVKAALKDSYSTHRAVSVGVGLFRNELAEVFDRLNKGRPEEKDFLPLFDIYDLYTSVDPEKRIDENAKVIESFRGVVIYEKFSQQTAAGARFEDTAKVAGGIAFLRGSVGHTGEWSRSTESQTEAGYYRVIVSPNGFDLIKVPSKEQIEAAWKSQPRLPLRISGNASRVQISEFEPGKVEIGIGPIPIEAANGVSARLVDGEKGVLQQAERDRVPTVAEGRYAWIPVRITASPDIYRSAQIREFLDTQATVRLELANGLWRDYPVPVRIAMKPQPVRTTDRYEPTASGDRHEWLVKYRVEPSEGYSTANVIPKRVTCRGEALRTFAGALRLETQRLEKDQFTLPVKWEGGALDPATPEYCEAEIEFELRDNQGTHPRNLRVDLKMPRRQDPVAAVRVSAADADLSKVLTESIAVTSDLTVGEIRESSATVIERNKIIQDNLPVRYDREAREFVVPRDLVDKDKLRPPD